ncbi:MAG TPA: hypothetical protein VFR34_12450, partial [Paracoccaceae bacterium]|nr:hypothetical protein [Paracoccaceae bacterium]
PGEPSEAAPHPGTTPMMVEAMVLRSLYATNGPETYEARARLLLDRALDIARGGSGRIEQKPAEGANVL